VYPFIARSRSLESSLGPRPPPRPIVTPIVQLLSHGESLWRPWFAPSKEIELFPLPAVFVIKLINSRQSILPLFGWLSFLFQERGFLVSHSVFLGFANHPEETKFSLKPRYFSVWVWHLLPAQLFAVTNSPPGLPFLLYALSCIPPSSCHAKMAVGVDYRWAVFLWYIFPRPPTPLLSRCQS